MLESNQTITTSIIKARSFFLFMLVIVLLGTGITLILTWVSRIFIPIGLFIFWIGPLLLFQKKLRGPFLKKITLNFFASKIEFEIYNFVNNDLEKKFESLFDQIDSFKIINSQKDDSSFLKISFKDKTNIAYTFVGQSNEGKSTDITELFMQYIHQYNRDHSEQEKITLMPSFFGTRAGSVIIFILVSVFICLIIYQIIYIPKSIPLTIFGSIFLLLNIIFQRKRDLRDLNDFNKSN